MLLVLYTALPTLRSADPIVPFGEPKPAPRASPARTQHDRRGPSRQDGPVSAVRRLTTIPHGRTARRLEWPHLPPRIRELVEQRCGSPVLEAASQDAGFTPGFASVLTCADGSRHFVKAASARAPRMFAEPDTPEARKLSALPPEPPAPRLPWAPHPSPPPNPVPLA